MSRPRVAPIAAPRRRAGVVNNPLPSDMGKAPPPPVEPVAPAPAPVGLGTAEPLYIQPPPAREPIDVGKLRELFELYIVALTTEGQGDRSLPMNFENAGELVSLGTDIVRLGAQLKEARAEADDAVAMVKKIEAELQPKLLRHAELIQQAAGLAFPAAPPRPAVAPAAQLPDWAPPIANLIDGEAPATAPGPSLGLHTSSNPALTPNGQLKQRVKDYLKRRGSGDEGVSASDVADVLKIDSILVREAMREMQGGR